MNRELKFRAWGSEEKIMYNRVLAGPGDPCSIVWLEDKKEWVHFDESSGVIMQYTGLTDKNGREIWEGDTCEAVFTPEVIGPIYENPELLEATR